MASVAALEGELKKPKLPILAWVWRPAEQIVNMFFLFF